MYTAMDVPVKQKKNVEIYINNEQPVVDSLSSFHCCPLGVCFYSPRELTVFRVLRLSLAVPFDSSQRSIDCNGFVAYCQFEEEKGMFRIWVHFIDIPEHVRNELKCITKQSDLVCQHCMNF